MEKKHRDTGLDSITGLLVIYMIAYHVMISANMYCTPLYECTKKLFLLFLMPWFYFKGGLIHKQRSLNETMRQGAARLLKPFLVFSCLGLLLQWGRYYVCGELGWENAFATPAKELLLDGSIGGNKPLWFLPSLFAVRCIFCQLDTLLRRIPPFRTKARAVTAAAFCIVPAMAAFALYCMKVEKPFWVGNIVLGLAFYAAGRFFATYKPSRGLVALAFLGYLAFNLRCGYVVDFRCNQTTGTPVSYLVWLAAAGLACILYWQLSRRVGSLRIPALAHIGRGSMQYYCIHWLILYALATAWFHILHLPCGAIYAVCATIAMIVVLPLVIELNQAGFCRKV